MEQLRMRICQIGAFHSTTARTPSNADTLAQNLEKFGISSVCASKFTDRIRRPLDMLWTLLRTRRVWNVVVIHVYSGRAYLWALMSVIISKLLGKRIILWLHGGNLPQFSKKHSYLIDSAFSKADRIIAPSGYLASAFIDRYPIGIIRYELDVTAYPYRRREHVYPRLLWLRAFNYGYNPTLAVRVLHKLSKRFPSVHLTMCGPDNGDGSFQATQQLAQELGVDEKLTMPGKVTKDRIKQLGESCDIFLNTTNYDNTPVSVIEAMAMGMCVVSTNVGGMPYLVDDGKDGLLVHKDDSSEMVKSCMRYLNEPQLTATVSEFGRQKALQFDKQVVIDEWVSLLNQLDQQGQN